MGDRLLGVLTGLLYARLSNRAVYVDWRDGLYDDPGHNAFNWMFTIKGLPVLKNIPQTDSVYPPAWIGNLESSFHDLFTKDGNEQWNRALVTKKYCADLSKLDHREEVLVCWGFDQLPMIMEHDIESNFGWDSASVLGKILHEHIEFSPAIVSKASGFLHNYRESKIIGIHVRATTEARKIKQLPPFSSYLQALDTAIQAMPDAMIYVATDNIEAQKKIQKKYSDVIIREKWFPQAWQPIHSNESCPDTRTATEDALIEMWILSKCDYLIRHSSSAFSEIAELILRKSGRTVVPVFPISTIKERVLEMLKKFSI